MHNEQRLSRSVTVYPVVEAIRKTMIDADVRIRNDSPRFIPGLLKHIRKRDRFGYPAAFSHARGQTTPVFSNRE